MNIVTKKAKSLLKHVDNVQIMQFVT